jgi:hypothetical protein
MCTVLLPPGGYPTAVNIYIISYQLQHTLFPPITTLLNINHALSKKSKSFFVLYFLQHWNCNSTLLWIALLSCMLDIIYFPWKFRWHFVQDEHFATIPKINTLSKRTKNNNNNHVQWDTGCKRARVTLQHRQTTQCSTTRFAFYSFYFPTIGKKINPYAANVENRVS